MNKTEKTRPTVGAVEQAKTGNVLADSHSHDYCTSKAVSGQLKISELLSTGRENALPLRHLINITERDGRTIRLMIERERRSGVPILSDCKNGYFLAADEMEAQIFARSMRRRAGEIIKTSRAIERTAGID